MDHRRREPVKGVFRLVLPLRFPGLDRVNAYLLEDGDASTLVDCGIFDPSPARDHGWDRLVAALEACGVRPQQITRVIVTHPHIDHYGMTGRLMDETSCELWMHGLAQDELEIYRRPDEVTATLRETFVDHGVERADVDELTAFEDWRPFVSSVVDATATLEGGERLTVAGRDWEVVHTPGHSRSHVCMWAPADGTLISGDHLLATITPHIDFKPGSQQDPLGQYLASLEKTEKLEPALVLPGHGRPFEDGGNRARVIAQHHERRLGSILQVIRREPHTASEITDEIFGTTLLNFERRLALGEALAHLQYLLERGEIERIQQDDGTYLYKKVERKRAAESP